jgi:hypothetical protein
LQLFLLSGTANLPAGKLFGIEKLAKIGVEKIDQLIMRMPMAERHVEQPALPLVWRGKPCCR